MSARLEELLNNPGMGHGQDILRHLFEDEARVMAAMHPDARTSVSKHKFYNAIDFKKDARTYARHLRDYMKDYVPVVMQDDDIFQQKLKDHHTLQLEYQDLVHKYHHVHPEQVSDFATFQPPPDVPVLVSDEEMPPPLVLKRSSRSNWFDKMLEGRKLSRKPKSKKGKKSRKPEPVNARLYARIKSSSCKQYKNPSLVRSKCIVGEYVKRGGTYKGNRKNSSLTRGFRRWNNK